MGKVYSYLMRALEKMSGQKPINRTSSALEWWRYSDSKVDPLYNLSMNTDWIYACTEHRATSFANVKWQLELETGRNESEVVDNHVFYELMANVNDELVEWDFWKLMQTSYDITGEFFCEVVRGPLGAPVKLIPILPNMGRMEVHRDDYGDIVGYRLWTSGGNYIAYAPDELFYYRSVSIASNYRGMPLLNALIGLATMDRTAKEWIINSLKNDATPSIAITTDKQLTAEIFKQKQGELQSAFGGSKKARRLMFFDSGMTVNAVGLSPKEMDFVNSLDVTGEQIRKISGVPKHYFGDGTVTKADAEMAETIYSRNTVLPLVTLRDHRMTQNFLARFYPRPARGRLIMRSVDVVPRDRMLQMQEDEAMLRQGRTTINDLRKRDGAEPVEGGDEPLIMSGMSTLKAVVETSANKKVL